jgi:hypothetical protein
MMVEMRTVSELSGMMMAAIKGLMRPAKAAMTDNEL